MVCDQVFVGDEFQKTRYAGQAGAEHGRFIFTWSMISQLFKRGGGGKKGGGKDKPDDCTPDDPHHGGGG